MRRLFPALLTLLIMAPLGACGDDDPAPISPDDIRLRKVSGDRQTSRVANSADAAALRASSADADALRANSSHYELLPEPLVVQLTDSLGNVLGSISSAGSGLLLEPNALVPAASLLPANTVVGFHVLNEGPCGAAFVGAALPDDSAHATERWIKGTLAADCQMEARLLVDGEPKVATTFTATFLPGPLAQVYGIAEFSIAEGDSIDIRDMGKGGRDQHRNEIPPDTINALPGSEVRWYWTDDFADPSSAWTGPQQTGWIVNAPAMDTTALESRVRQYVRPDPAASPNDQYYDGVTYQIRVWGTIATVPAFQGTATVVYCLDGQRSSLERNGCP